MPTTFRRLRLAAVCVAAFAGPSIAAAETLADALALAYQSNPQLQSQRALQRQLDETYVQARSGLRPQLSASSSLSWYDPGLGADNSLGVTLSASQPLYNGGRTAAAIDAAEATVMAGRQTLRSVEQTVLQQVVQAFQDVLRDQQIVGIRQQSVSVLSSQLDEIRARFEVGLVTRTDVARGEAELANARAQLSSAQASLASSRAAYATAVGQNPGELVAPATLPGLPGTVDDAFQVAEAGNPALRRARITEQASRYRVQEARAARRPTVSLQGSVGYSGPVSGLGDFDRSITVSGVISQPLYSGGSINSQVRSAVEQNNSDRILIEQARREAVQDVAQAWNTMQAAQANIVSNQEQVRAAAVAFEGTQEQYRVGLSTTLDVLLTQETLRSAQLSLVQSQRDLYVAQATLLTAIGRLDAQNLIQGAPLYDPQASFDRVKARGAMPWDPLVEGLDSIGAPAPADPTRPIQAPAAPAGPPTLKPASPGPTAAAGLSSVVPTNPNAATGLPPPARP